jgi:PAS domain-containing protein
VCVIQVFEQCTSEVSLLLLDDEDDDDDTHRPSTVTATSASASNAQRFRHADEIRASKAAGGTPKQMARILMEPDFRLIEALIHSQQNFVLSDPSLPDNPIVYCSDGFCSLTGYKRSAVIGRFGPMRSYCLSQIHICWFVVLLL